MEKLLFGFVLGFLACTWTYELDAGEAFFGFGRKFVAACDQFLDIQGPVREAQGDKVHIPLPLSEGL
ncbi:hypothetical protein FHS78_000040 [Parvibaculum indicum]|uniref:hypothetical protein n=1 Tax=Parvibaculum indicum TaxID=562969 RepID=UPI00141F26E5|nr:hypothetical protein [Parvibaculum indicum]NIJ39785.1 hypothetical protein [Parvibaculum indicum]